jgi:aconitate hydratase 2/2-methylisocitrate dehydratase
MGTGSQVYLGSSHVATICALTGKIPTVEEYMTVYDKKIKPVEEELAAPMAF